MDDISAEHLDTAYAKGTLPGEQYSSCGDCPSSVASPSDLARFKLFPDECPKTVENFTTHAINGYYDGVIFHRVIKGFMVQTGDPLGDGTVRMHVHAHISNAAPC